MRPWDKVEAKSAAEVCQRFSLSGEARALLGDGLSPKQFVERLVERGQLPEAARFLAHALPKREAVWWASQCARQVYGARPEAAVESAIQAAQLWSAAPSEGNRRAAEAASSEAGPATPAGCAALAAFFSGGSLAPPTAPPVPPAEHLTARAVAGAIMLAAVLKEPERASDRYRAFFALGSDVANGVNRWK